MLNSWPIVKFGSLYKEPSRNGLTKPKKVRGEGVKFINMGEIFKFDRMDNIPCDRVPVTDKEKSASLMQDGDLLFARQSLVLSGAGKCSIFLGDNEEVVFESHLIRVRLDTDIVNPEYAYYYFMSPQGRANISTIVEQGAGQAGIRGNDLQKLEFPLPPKEYQDYIVENVRFCDLKIELNKQTNQTLEQIAQTLFKSWFVDFDPVFDNLLAKVDFKLENLADDFPEALLKCAKVRLLALDDEAKKRLTSSESPQSTHQHFPSEFEYNEQLGWIPKGWEVSTTDDEFVVKGGSTPSTKNPDFWDGGDIHWTSPKDLSGNDTKIMLDTNRKITGKGLAKITSGLLPVDTVLMSSRAPVGYLALAKVPVAINQGYIAITDAKTLSSEYTIQWLESVMDEIKSISGGTTFAEISKKTFKSIQIVIPQKDAVDAYTQIAKANYQRITANVQEIHTLTETRNYLLPKLISGEINLNGVEHE